MSMIDYDLGYDDGVREAMNNRDGADRIAAASSVLREILAEEMIYTGAILETLEASGQHTKLVERIKSVLCLLDNPLEPLA